jgi:peptidyl-dipeptidase Dcp
MRLLDDVWSRAVPALERERAELMAQMKEQGATHAIEPWDWRFWAEQVRQRQYAIDDAEVKPYFPLERMVAAAFDCAERLFGVRFVKREGLELYHPDVNAYEVRSRDGSLVGVFLHDNFARPSKRSGAWMSSYRQQTKNGGAVAPIVVNNNNFAKSAPGQPTLLSFDDVRTLFHEFGHGLHGLLSNVGYERLSGTNVLRDFVELPSQLFEHWTSEPEVLRRHARHVATGEPIPDELIERLKRARRFGQAFETVRYTASALTDMAVHALPQGRVPADPVAFEAKVLRERGLPPGVGVNHRFTHFQHLFYGSGYAAGYYVYLWAEVLDADAFDAFTEAGSAFDPKVAGRLLKHIYSAGDSVEPGATYEAFRGRAARVESMLEKKGLLQPA